MTNQNSIRQLLEWATDTLSSISCSARLDSEVLLAFCLGKDRAYLMTWPERVPAEKERECFESLINRRLKSEPIAYLVGSREFYSMELNTTPATLVPRPETEMLVDKVLELAVSIERPDILDLGSGTGAIALALKKHCPDSRIIATDLSHDALQVARSNAARHHLDVEFIESDWYQSISSTEKFDIIVSNPPYIAESDPYLSQGDLPAEPQQALTSGVSGLDDLRQIIGVAGKFLKNDGWLVLEHGYDQQQPVNELLVTAHFSSIRTVRDFNNHPRMTFAQALENTPNKSS